MTERLDVGALLRRLHEARIEHILIGGLAVAAWGVIRSTKDIDICPSPDQENLARLANFLRRVGATQLGVGIRGFAEPEMGLDPTRAEDLAAGPNFRLLTPLGVLDIMQRVPGIAADNAYATLAADAELATAFGIEIKVCSLDALRLMKRAVGRPQDLQDIADLDRAHSPAELGWRGMPTNPEPITLFEVAKRAVDLSDPDGTDSRLGELLEQFEDADEPVTTIDNLEERVAIAVEGVDVEIEDPAVSMAAATILYLARRRDELDGDPDTVLRLAARAEWRGDPPDSVRDWLSDRGIEL